MPSAAAHLRKHSGPFAVIGAGLVVYLIYFAHTPFYVRNTDAVQHLKYIELIAHEHALPSAARCPECHHPPAHYLLAAVVYAACERAGIEGTRGLQVFSLALWMVFLGFAAATLQRLLDRPWQRLLALALVVFWPYSVIQSVRVGNDALVDAVASVAIYFGVRWFEDLRARWLVAASLAAVLGLLTKASALMLPAMIVAIVLVQEAQRRIQVQYAKRIIGRKVYGGQSTYIPLRINQGGVIPIIFASSVLLFPATIAQFVPNPAVQGVVGWLSPSGSLYLVFYFFLIFFFTYFYTAITFNPAELAENIKKYGGFITGIRPGKPTAQYLEYTITRLTLVGATFLAIIAVVPSIIESLTHITSFQGLGSTSLLIVVGVGLDLVRQIETHLVTRQYEGLLA